MPRTNPGFVAQACVAVQGVELAGELRNYPVVSLRDL